MDAETLSALMLFAAIAAAFFNVWLLLRFASFMTKVEKQLGTLSDQLSIIAKRIDAGATGTDVRLEELVKAVRER